MAHAAVSDISGNRYSDLLISASAKYWKEFSIKFVKSIVYTYSPTGKILLASGK